MKRYAMQPSEKDMTLARTYRGMTANDAPYILPLEYGGRRYVEVAWIKSNRMIWPTTFKSDLQTWKEDEEAWLIFPQFHPMPWKLRLSSKASIRVVVVECVCCVPFVLQYFSVVNVQPTMRMAITLEMSWGCVNEDKHWRVGDTPDLRDSNSQI